LKEDRDRRHDMRHHDGIGIEFVAY
jgi:hypothetical protein